MAFAKQYGPVGVSESAGKVSVTISAVEGAGGITASINASATLDSEVFVDAGLGALSSKFPSLSVEIGALKALVDAEIAKA